MVYPPSGPAPQRGAKTKEKTMCITPSYFWLEVGPNWEKIPKGCGHCWRCHANKLNDYVGRSLCEAAYSTWTVAVTLTYADKPERAKDLAHKVITPRHFQDAIRALRKRGHKIRYLVAGEYGDLKGRAHFHAVLFGSGDKPEIPEKENCNVEWWPHGHIFADWSADERALRYVCKYIMKDRKNGWFSLSKKPTLGHEFFQHKAEVMVEQGAMPRSFEYLPPAGHRGRPYLMTGATRRDFLLALVDETKRQRPVDMCKLSEWVRRVLEKLDRDRAVRLLERVSDPVEQMSILAEELDRKRMTSRQGLRAALDVDFNTM